MILIQVCMSVFHCFYLSVSISASPSECLTEMIPVLFVRRRLLPAGEADKRSSYEDGAKHTANKEKTSDI